MKKPSLGTLFDRSAHNRCGMGSHLVLFFCDFMKILGKGNHKFPPVDPKFIDSFIIITDENILEIEELLNGKIISTHGHTSDSISLLLPNRIMFCGDAAMNGFPSLHKITIWVESKEDFENSWSKVIASTPKKIYLLGKKQPDLVGADVIDKTGNKHLGIVEISVPILKGNAALIKEIREKLYAPEFAEMLVNKLTGSMPLLR